MLQEDAFDCYVRQTTEVDFKPFIKPLASLPRKSPEHFNRALALAHDEDVSAWSRAIADWMQQHRSSLPLLELMRAVQMPLLNELRKQRKSLARTILARHNLELLGQ